MSAVLDLQAMASPQRSSAPWYFNSQRTDLILSKLYVRNIFTTT